MPDDLKPLDALLPDDEPSPYAIMARYGVTPRGTAAQVLDASYEMDAAAMGDERISLAWESLRTSRTRLQVDFLCVQLPPEPPAVAAPAGRPAMLPWRFLRRMARQAPPLDLGEREEGFTPRPSLDGRMPAWPPTEKDKE